MQTISTHAAAAKAMRTDLKKAFPTTSFSVRARSFAGGDAVDVEWMDGPSSKEVNSVIGKYQYGHFDGMQDLYEYTNSRNDIPQVKYVQIRREISETILENIYKEIKTTHSGWENLTGLNDSSYELMNKWSFWTPREYIMHHYIRDRDLTNGYAAA